MTDVYANQSLADEIDDTNDLPSERLSRQADRMLGGDGGGARPLRQAVREDLHDGRIWAEARAERARDAITEDPMRSTIYALALGFFIGVLLKR